MFYSRITPIVLVVATSAFWIVAMGFLLLSSQEKQNEECSHSWEKIRNFTQETIQLRAGAERINDRSAELEVKYKESTEKLKRLGAPSAAVMEESHLPFEAAAEAAPGESWQFEFGGETYALLLLAIEQNPPGARISFRRLPS